MTLDYRAFLESKAQLGDDGGFAANWIPDFLFDFQASLVEWSLRKGRTALFEDCGLGKTPQQLVWAENVARHTNGRVLILTPLAVSAQTIREAEKFGIEATRSIDGGARRITVTNYERLHLFTAADFDGVVCDESSILKNFDGQRKEAITEFMRRVPYRLLCTATAAPNDYIEFGTHSEALGQLGYMDMLNRFFKNDQNSSHPNRHWAGGAKWRFRGHAERDFWRWMCSWARALRKPSDLGFDDGRFVLPDLLMRDHVVRAKSLGEGMIFQLPAVTLKEQRGERKRTLQERCARAADLVNGTGQAAVVWCYLNAEGDLLEQMIPDAVQVSGDDDDVEKEAKLTAFTEGRARVVVTKPILAGFGLNWQHCAHQTFFPSHSFEQFYQAIRRSWRFGQQREVVVDVITSEGEAGVMANLKRKADAMATAFERLVVVMNDELRIERSSEFQTTEEIPAWL